MIWPLYITRQTVSRREINSPVSRVLEIVRDPETYAKLNPLVTKVEKDPDSDIRYRITDRMTTLCGLVTYEYTITGEWMRVNDTGEGMGVDIVVELGPGRKIVLPKLVNILRAKEIDFGRTEFTETVQLTALFFMMPFILRTLVRSHETILDRLAEMAEASEDNTAS